MSGSTMDPAQKDTRHWCTSVSEARTCKMKVVLKVTVAFDYGLELLVIL